MTTICCISDTHLGCRHRMKKERLAHYEKAFMEAIKKAAGTNPELIIFGGDIFHHATPDPQSMKLAINSLLKLAKSSEIVVCIGNHEIEGHLKTAYPPLFSEINEKIHVLSSENPHTEIVLGEKTVKVHGFQYLRNRENAENTLKKITSEIHKNPNEINILCMHQAIEGFLTPFEISLKTLKEIEPGYDLIISGHMHRHQRMTGIKTPAYYIGSTERISFNEAENKTGLLVFQDFDFENPAFIEVESASMKSIKEDLGKKTPAEINEKIRDIIEKNRDTQCLHISIRAEVDGDCFEIRREWEKDHGGHAILDVAVSPKMKDAAVKIEKTEIDAKAIDEYFEKKGMQNRKDLKDMCMNFYEKYGR